MISIFDTHEAAARAAADLVTEHIIDHPATNVGLAGGSTPATAYAELSRRSIEWSDVTLWLGDERWVAPDHPDTNSEMAKATLGPAAARRVLAPDYRLDDPGEAAASYGHALIDAFSMVDSDARPHLVLLGVGDDGHTASLFPGSPALDVRDRDYIAAWVPVKAAWRLTATLRLLWSAHRVVFLATGEAKADILHRILDDEEPLPARLVASGAAEVTWVVDEAAASGLRESSS